MDADFKTFITPRHKAAKEDIFGFMNRIILDRIYKIDKIGLYQKLRAFAGKYFLATNEREWTRMRNQVGGLGENAE